MDSHVEDSKVAMSPQFLGTAFTDGSIDASVPYEVKLLCSVLEPVCMIAWMMSRSLDYCTASVCTKTSAPLTELSSSIPC